ncbi:TIGR01906 family membrane protein [Arthrobacter sp. PAMC25284]|uniref:TIGR01906 family membrane protein n=1 Tax=Arthrobacter sp. PAMC25284 TaxID=2861279 RepID=UPI002159062D|nr:TIGR01906 family membrane protein [Arthrobacter sp. PAMC25284]
MTETSPTPPDRQDPLLDPTDDGDEPAFDWMKPAPAATKAGDGTAGPVPETRSGQHSDPAGDPVSARDAASAGDPVSARDAASARDATSARDAASAGDPVSARDAGGRAPQESPGRTVPPHPEQPAPPVPPVPPAAWKQPDSRAVRKAAEAASGDAGAGRGTSDNEPSRTSALQVRPPQEEVERRNAEREQAAKAKPVAPRVMQVLLAVFYPVILLVLAVRAVTSPLFLWVEYNRPGFPGDGYGFSTDDRTTYGSYAVDYLSNWSGARYLGELVNRSGDNLFTAGEVSHMADVKLVILSAFTAGFVLILLSVVAMIYLRRRSPGGVRRGLFAGSIATLVIIIGLGVLASLGWEKFFADFHSVFFASGTWTFSLQDTLIRLFPGQFWVDAGIVIGVLVLAAAVLTAVLTWPTRKRRNLAKDASATEAPRNGDASAEAEAQESNSRA